MTEVGLGRLAAAALFAAAIFALTAAAALASFPGRNGRIAYTGDDGRIHTIRPSGRGDQPIGPSTSRSPAWVPNGKQLAFVRGGELPDTWADIYTMSANGSDVQRITPLTYQDNLSPSYSPGGSRFLFIVQGCCEDRFIHIYDSHRRPHIRHLRTQDRDGDRTSSAVWAPDGKITYTLQRENADIYDLWTIRPDGTHEHRLLRHGVGPIYAPSGKRFLFARYKHGHSRYLVADADGSNVRKPRCNRLIQRMGQVIAYSPNGKQLLVSKGHDHSGTFISNLFRLSFRSCTRERVVSGEVVSDADWQALPAP